jgi:hypothetical protein
MMRPATLYLENRALRKNVIFDIKDANLGFTRNKYVALKDAFEIAGFDLSTQDINPLFTSDLHVYLDMPKVLPQKKDFEKSFLILMEPEVVRPENFNLSKHIHFKKIFTWRDDLVDNSTYFKISYSFKLSVASTQKKSVLTSMIAANKRSFSRLSLYRERVKILRWFESNDLSSFNLYGYGWRKCPIYISEKLFVINIISRLLKVPYFKLKSYRGSVDDKSQVLGSTSFVFCLENSSETGYVSEKIFDCFCAGSVPIYLGAPNIFEIVPKDTFILYEGIRSLPNLLKSLKNMSAKEYSQYLKNISVYLDKKAIKDFSPETFAKTVVSHIVKK